MCRFHRSKKRPNPFNDEAFRGRSIDTFFRDHTLQTIVYCTNTYLVLRAWIEGSFMRAQDWSRFLPESSLSFSISLFLFLWFLVVLLLRFRDSPGTCACLVAPPIGQNPRTLERETPRLGYPPLFSRGCSACGCAVVSGAASTTGVACSARG